MVHVGRVMGFGAQKWVQFARFAPPLGDRYAPQKPPGAPDGQKNCFCRSGRAPPRPLPRPHAPPVAFIDFDTAHPGPRVWDAAYTAYRFVPLYAPDEVEHSLPVPEAGRRLGLFADAYGLSEVERAALPGVAAERLRALVACMRKHAAAGHPAFSRHVAEGHDRRYLTDARWIESTFR